MVRLIVVGLLAFAVALTGTAYAEVQNIKVSGDLELKGITSHDYDLKHAQDNLSTGGITVGPAGVARGAEGANAADSDDDDASFFLSTTHVRVDADLTDNVQASVRLLNQRVWDAHSADESVHVDNAYMVLKEFLYSPLTVIAGRQDLNYGTGFIVGPGILADPEGVFGVNDTNGIHAGGIGQEHSAYNAYDAIRAILDFAPLTVEGVIAKINETGATTNDQDLYGVVVNYKLDQWSAEIEPYWFYKDNEADTVTTNDSLVTTAAGDALRTYESNEVHTVGLRLAGSPIEHLRLSGEGAHQFGDLVDITPVQIGAGDEQQRDRSAWAARIRAEYDWVTVPWTPTTGVGWVFYSGEQASNEAQGVTGTTPTTVGASGLPPQDQGKDNFNAWDPMYRGEFHTFIQDFLGGRDAPAGIYTTFDVNDTASTTNRHLIFGDVGLKPMEDLTLWARYTHVRFDKAPRVGRSHHAGDEIDAKVVYDYTDDVALTAWGGWFLPGEYYDEPGSNDRGNSVAWTTGGAASVKF